MLKQKRETLIFLVFGLVVGLTIIAPLVRAQATRQSAHGFLKAQPPHSSNRKARFPWAAPFGGLNW